MNKTIAYMSLITLPDLLTSKNVFLFYILGSLSLFRQAIYNMHTRHGIFPFKILVSLLALPISLRLKTSRQTHSGPVLSTKFFSKPGGELGKSHLPANHGDGIRDPPVDEPSLGESLGRGIKWTVMEKRSTTERIAV